MKKRSERMAEPIHVVIWSGGMDSTLVLDQVCADNPSRCIWAYTVNWDMLNDLKVKKEKEVRRNYLSYAAKKGYHIAHRTIRVTANMGAEDLGFAQGLAWFSYITPYLPKNSILYFGYHSGDATSAECAPLFEKLIKTVAKISTRKIRLSFPLQFKGKCGILEEFKSRQIPLSCFWTCEDPKRRSGKIVRCGKCTPCIKLKAAVYESKLRKSVKVKKEKR